MKKLKDFIYDKNDIVIAVLILAVAALIISWRLDIILEYPKQLLGNDDPAVQTPVGGDENPSGDETDQSGDDEDGQAGNDDQSGDNDQSGNGEGEGTQTGIDEPADIPLWDGGMLTEDVEVEVEGASASAAVKCLINAGLFEDYAEYQAICEEEGMNHEKVAAGSFTFKKGSTKKEIAKKINWS